MRRKIERVTISLMDDEKLLSLSSGEVTVGDSIDIQTGLPVKDGLMSQRIFGPVQRGVCECGQYHPEYKTRLIKCPKCKVMLVDPAERRRRFGHIALTVPVVHPWYRRHLALLLGIPPKTFYELINCQTCFVFHPGASPYKKEQIIPFPEYLDYGQKDGADDLRFKAYTGGKLVRELLANLDLEEVVRDLRSKQASRRVNKRLILARDLLKSGTDPKSMLIENLLVLPPDLRPVVVFDDGTTASSDLNDLYARIIHRNNRLKHFYENAAPENVLATDRALLQAAVDALIDNEKRQKATNRTGKKILKSLSGGIEKKEGRIRRNLLGKRVDYSGRSVIAVDPTLKLNQCGLPMELAINMLRPFVYGRLRQIGHAATLKHAQAMVVDRHPAALDALEYVLQEKVILLNRAPSLHRMSIQGFNPVLVYDRAIRLHPLVCSAFNADFDGDQMSVHTPVTVQAQIEARVLMLSINNILSPASGKISISPSQDIVLGIYYLTKDRNGRKGEGKCFSDRDDVITAYETGFVELHSKVKVRLDGQLVDTTPGRMLFSEVFPAVIPFSALNKTIKKKDLGKLIEMCFDKAGHVATVVLVDKIKEMGFKFATRGGLSISIADVTIPQEKHTIIRDAENQVSDIAGMHARGLLSDEEKHNKIVDIWKKTSEDIGDKMMDSFGVREGDTFSSEQEKADIKEFNSLYMMADSGARGSKDQMRQLAGMRGLMAKPNGEIVEIPIKSSLKEGLTYFEYLLSCHGARKGRADGALKTANAGYFTRRLVDTAHDVIINAKDCGTTQGFKMAALYDGDDIVIPLSDRIVGRVAVQPVINPVTGEEIVHVNSIITKTAAEKIAAASITEVNLRSPIACELETGICATCYGYELSTRTFPEIGDAIGIVAAQSIGEPGTQLTLRTFHSGGTAAGGSAKSSVVAKENGTLVLKDIKAVSCDEGGQRVISRNGRAFLLINGLERDMGKIPYGSVLSAEEGAQLAKDDKIAEWDPFQTPVICLSEGPIEYQDVVEHATMRKESDEKTGVTLRFITAISRGLVPRAIVGEKEYILPIGAFLAVEDGGHVKPGDIIAKRPKKAALSSDITGGLSRVLQVLEVRKLHDPAVLAEITGEIKVHPPRRKKLPVEIIGASGESKMYHVPLEKPLNVYSGDVINAGELIVDGIVDTRDVLRILGSAKAAAHVIDEVQKVYRSQGVEINDKHLEVVLRKMLAKVRISDPGDTDFVMEEIVSKRTLKETNDKCIGKPAEASPIILSLVRTALLSDSWLSAASFQGTSTVLAAAAIRKRADPLYGTKENIIVGNIVPVGTGHPTYMDQTFVVPQKMIDKALREIEAEKRKKAEIMEAQQRFAALFPA